MISLTVSQQKLFRRHRYCYRGTAKEELVQFERKSYFSSQFKSKSLSVCNTKTSAHDHKQHIQRQKSQSPKSIETLRPLGWLSSVWSPNCALIVHPLIFDVQEGGLPVALHLHPRLPCCSRHLLHCHCRSKGLNIVARIDWKIKIAKSSPCMLYLFILSDFCDEYFDLFTIYKTVQFTLRE